MYARLAWVNDKIQKICEVTGVLLLITLFLLTSLQIAARQMGISLPWPGQVAQYLLVAFVFLALPVLFRTGEDISFRPLLERFSYELRRALYISGDFILVLLFIFLFISATQAARFTLGIGLSSVRWLRIGYVYIFIGIMMLITILPVIEEIIAYWNRAEETKDRSLNIADITDGDQDD